jgi:polysaccharide deacetylase 2 family uncharacterized protein YibQ
MGRAAEKRPCPCLVQAPPPGYYYGVASKNHPGHGQNTARRSGRLSLFIMAILILLAIILAIIIIFSTNRLPWQQTTSTTVSTTTLWPYGQPEYSIEIPEGYEALLPGSENANQAPHDPEGKTLAPLEMEFTRPVAIPKEKAEPYILKVKAKMLLEGQKPTLIIVIDDAGYNMEQLKPFLELPFPLSIAVLPQVGNSTEAARLAAEAEKEVLLHQPMQALGGNNPGPGAILLGMERDEVVSLLGRNLESLPQAIGVNNHMGSAITRDEGLMGGVLELVKKRGIYYLDSLTAPGTVTSELCRALSIPYWERDVFLDNTGDRQSILRALEEGKKIASTRGASVLVGHVWSSELAQTLMDIYPQLVEEGYSLSTISKYMIQSAIGDHDARSGN